jgi:protocatechuate 3,4-dioxygenase beta subunit
MRTLFTLAALFIAQQQGPLTVDGVIAKAGTSDPVSKAIVELRRLGNAPEPLVQVTTGADGRFEFGGIAPGRYRVSVSRSGYVVGSAGSARDLTVQGSSVRNLRLSLTPTGAISGRVFGDDGEPLARVSVEALKYNWEDGQRTLKEVQSAQTDDRGEFRLYWLPPGRYYLRATASGGRIGDMASHSPDGKFIVFRQAGDLSVFARKINEALPGSSNSYAPVYYPGTTDPQAASAVDVGAGADIGGMDFVLVRAVTRRVRVSVIDSATGLPAPNPQVTLVPRNGSGPGGFFVPGDGGILEAQGVLPGSYFLMASARISAGNDSFWIRGGRVPVDVADKDVDQVTVVLQPAATISGRLVVEGGQSGADRHPVVSLRRTPEGGPMNSELYADFPDDRQFSIDSILEGDYRVQVSDLPPGTFVKSVRVDGAEVLNGSFYVDPRALHSLEVVLGANAGTVSGVVMSAGDSIHSVPTPGGSQPLARASVALVPAVSAGARERPDLFRGAQTDELGRFQIDGVSPGEYLLFAWEDIDEALWRDPEFIRRNERLGRPLRISESGRERTELTALPIQ